MIFGQQNKVVADFAQLFGCKSALIAAVVAGSELVQFENVGEQFQSVGGHNFVFAEDIVDRGHGAGVDKR